MLFSLLYDPNNYTSKTNNYFWLPIRRLFRRIFERILRKIVDYKFSTNNFVFIVSTMRSGSTLLNHILAQNNKFLSIGESHTVYQNKYDLKTLMLKTLCYYKIYIFKNRTYIEKTVLNEQIDSLEFLNFNQIKKIIFLIRDPVGTISSLLRTNFPHSDSIDTAAEYYKKRLQNILLLSDSIQEPDKGIVITYDDLISNSKVTLNVLSKFLNLDQKLSSNYRMQKWSTVWGKGDVGSEKIRTGKINSTQQTLENIYTRTIQSLRNKHNSIP